MLQGNAVACSKHLH